MYSNLFTDALKMQRRETDQRRSAEKNHALSLELCDV